MFAATCWVLDRLHEGGHDIEVVLRQYEQVLLRELGYALDFTRDGGTGAPIQADAHYWFDPHTGFVRAPYPPSRIGGTKAKPMSQGK